MGSCRSGSTETVKVTGQQQERIPTIPSGNRRPPPANKGITSGRMATITVRFCFSLAGRGRARWIGFEEGAREEGEEKKHAAHHLDVIAKGSNHEGDKWV